MKYKSRLNDFIQTKKNNNNFVINILITQSIN